MQAGDESQDGGLENESAARQEASASDRSGVLTPVSSHPHDNEWRRIGLGLRALLSGAIADPIPVEMERGSGHWRRLSRRFEASPVQALKRALPNRVFR